MPLASRPSRYSQAELAGQLLWVLRAYVAHHNQPSVLAGQTRKEDL